MDIIQTFYNQMASQYDKLFEDWDAATKEQAQILHKLFTSYGFDQASKVLDCACGIGTQAIGLAALGYQVTGSDLSEEELYEAKSTAKKRDVQISFFQADFCALSATFSQPFDIIIAMDNALPHMLTKESLKAAIQSMTAQLRPGGIFVASIRDYDALLAQKPPYSPPYIHQTPKGQRVAFQTWQWEGEIYRLTQYIIEDEENLSVSKFTCAYRATTREEMTSLLKESGCQVIEWKFPEETGFYQPIVVGRKVY